MTVFDYSPIRATALALVKQFGNNEVPCILLRNVNAEPADEDKPWRGDDAVIKQFQFIAVESTLDDEASDADRKLLVPGDIVDVAADDDSSTLCGAPLVTDRIQLPSGIYAILGPVKDVSGAGVPIIFKLRLRAWPQLLTQPSTPF